MPRDRDRQWHGGAFLARDNMQSVLYAIARPPVCHTGGLVKNGRSHDYAIFTTR